MPLVGVVVGLFNLFRWLLRSLRITGSEKARAKDVAPVLLMGRRAPHAIDGRVDAHGAVFVSYSRSDAPLVDDVVRGLEADAHRVFVDYRSLEPGRPWSDQLDAAMTTSPVIVVVVSDRAVWESANVRKEWLEAVDRGQRIVLGIAEPVPLPPALAGQPWVDLRRGLFSRRVGELSKRARLEREDVAAGRLPESAVPLPPTAPGLRQPWALWLAFVMSVPLAVVSIALWFTGLTVLLLPLPMRILQRRGTLGPVVPVCVAAATVALSGAIFWREVVPLVVAGYLLAVALSIRRHACRRWLEPIGPRVTWPSSLFDEATHVPRPTRFWIDVAPQDLPYVQQVVDALESAGHACAGWTGPAGSPEEGPAPGDLVLRFVSRFNDRDELVATTRTIPILLSDPDDDLPPVLQSTQWLDLRFRWPKPGSPELSVLARWLDEPGEVMNRLGVAPSYQAFVLPRDVRRLHDGLVVSVASLAVAGLVGGTTDGGPGPWLAAVVAAVIGVRAILLIRTRTPTPRFGWYFPAMEVLAIVAAVALIGTPFLALLAMLPLTVVWLTSHRPIALWVPRVPEPTATLHAAPHRLPRTLRTFGTAVHDAALDSVGRTFRKERRERRHRPGARRPALVRRMTDRTKIGTAVEVSDEKDIVGS